jgi:hypothetical protein
MLIGQIVGWTVNDELEIIWIQTAVIRWRCYPSNGADWMRRSTKTSVKISVPPPNWKYFVRTTAEYKLIMLLLIQSFHLIRVSWSPIVQCHRRLIAHTQFWRINLFDILVGKREGERQLGIRRRRWVDNIKVDLREIGWGGMDWIDLVQDGDQLGVFVNTVINFRVAYNAGKFLNSCTTDGFSRRSQLHKIR